MTTTTYHIATLANDGVMELGTKSKKATAVAFADSYASQNKVDVTVTTGAGTIVHESKGATKKIKMSAPYTRVVAVPADVAETINGMRVAYLRKRVGFALLDAAKGEYTIYDVVNRRSVGEIEVATTREAGRWFADEAPALRAQIEAEMATA